MKTVFMVVAALATAGVRAQCESAAPLDTNATSSVALGAYRVLKGDVAGLPSVPGTTGVVGGVQAVPAVAEEAGRAPVAASLEVAPAITAAAGVSDRDLPFAVAAGAGNRVVAALEDWSRLRVAVGVGTNRVVAYAAMCDADVCAVDPLLSMIDVWSDGPLGRMRREAGAMRLRGDESGFESAAAEYWRAMERAVERRQVLGEREKRTRAVRGE